MKKYIAVLIILASLSFLMASCLYSETSDSQIELSDDETLINGKIYRHFYSEDIEQLISTNSLDDQVVDVVYGFCAVAIGQNKGLNFYQEYYIHNDEYVEGMALRGARNTNREGQINFFGGTASGDYPFIVLYINNPDFIDGRHSIKLIGDKGEMIYRISKTAHAFESKHIGDVRMYIVYDADGEECLKAKPGDVS